MGSLCFMCKEGSEKQKMCMCKNVEKRVKKWTQNIEGDYRF